jgi:hypothetical protein
MRRERLARERYERALKERWRQAARARIAAEHRRRYAQPSGPRYYRAGEYEIRNGYAIRRRGLFTFSDVWR